jgi:endo-1,4-beta-xylanase
MPSSSRPRFIQLLAAAAAPLPVACGEDRRPEAGRRALPPLKQAFAANFLIGAALEPAQLEDAADVELLTRHFSSITAENVMKPRTLAPDGAGRYAFADADRLVSFATDHGLKVRGHTLVWHQRAPAWFFGGDRARPEAYRALVRERLETYVTDVVTHFRGKVYAWDVVNEPASDDDGETYRTSSPWHEALGPSYIEYAFRAARAADPAARLFINDYGTQRPTKRARVLAIAADLLAGGVPVDGVGHQLHLDYQARASEANDALTAVEALGLDNHVTELDVSVYADPPSCTATSRAGCQADYGDAVPRAVLDAQAALYRDLFAVFKTHRSLTSVTTWGLSDNHTWLTRFPVARRNLPLMFDASRSPKWSWWGL